MLQRILSQLYQYPFSKNVLSPKSSEPQAAMFVQWPTPIGLELKLRFKITDSPWNSELDMMDFIQSTISVMPRKYSKINLVGLTVNYVYTSISL